MMTKTLADFQICISVPLKAFGDNILLYSAIHYPLIHANARDNESKKVFMVKLSAGKWLLTLTHRKYYKS